MGDDIHEAYIKFGTFNLFISFRAHPYEEPAYEVYRLEDF
jgi:hypothetical protein